MLERYALITIEGSLLLCKEKRSYNEELTLSNNARLGLLLGFFSNYLPKSIPRLSWRNLLHYLKSKTKNAMIHTNMFNLVRTT